MTQTSRIHSILIGWLALPFGIANAWIDALGYRLALHGFYRVPAMLLMATALSIYTWRIVGAPLVDRTFSLLRWYLIGLTLTIAGMLPFFWLPLNTDNSNWITILTCVSQIGAVLTLLATIGFMARSVSTDALGKAAGWYYTGIFGGQGLVLVVAIHFRSVISWELASIVEIGVILTSIIALFISPASRLEFVETAREAGTQLISDTRNWFRSAKGIFIMLMALSPIGVGAATVAWVNGFAKYEIPQDQFELIIGPFTTVASILGFLAGGWASDRFGRWQTWFRTSTLLAATALLLAFCPAIQWLFIAGILVYTFLAGCCMAAFWAIIVQAVSPRFAITKIVFLSMLTGFTVTYMQAWDGMANDDTSFQFMLIGEALLTLICIGIALLLKRRLKIA